MNLAQFVTALHIKVAPIQEIILKDLKKNEKKYLKAILKST